MVWFLAYFACCGKEDSEGAALGAKRPRSDRKQGDEERPKEARAIAAYRRRCRRPRQLEEGAGIRPLFEPGKTRRKQDDGSEYLPAAEDGEQIYRVAEACQDRDDRLASNQQRSPMHQIRPSTHQQLERDKDSGHPIPDHPCLHRRISIGSYAL